jgi:hypothetical protein
MAAFPFDTPSNTDSIQQLLYRLATLATVDGATASPATRAWGAFQQPIAGGSGFTSVKNVKCRSVVLTNNTGQLIQVSQDGVNFYTLQTPVNIGISSTATIYVKENAAEILLRQTNQNAFSVNLDVLYFT